MSKRPPCQTCLQRVKIGRNRSGTQRYKCRECGHTHTPEPALNGYAPHLREEALRLHLKGTKYRRISRILKVNHQTVINWINMSNSARLPQADASVNRDGRNEGLPPAVAEEVSTPESE